MTAEMISHHQVMSSTYAGAIQLVGIEADGIWGNGNWTLLDCHAHPDMTSGGITVMWKWVMMIQWNGLV